MRKITTLLAVALALAAPSPALAQSGADGYTPPGPPETQQVTERALPYTGYDLVFLGGFGVILLGAGLATRYLTKGT